jgi:hypothetical protein
MRGVQGVQESQPGATREPQARKSVTASRLGTRGHYGILELLVLLELLSFLWHL